jgi:hypothetical protein
MLWSTVGYQSFDVDPDRDFSADEAGQMNDHLLGDPSRISADAGRIEPGSAVKAL